MLKINEIFYSIQGESSLAGTPTTFVRLTGCNLRCHYCDTKYAYHNGESWSFENIFSKIESFGASHVCVTGGEPLLQSDCFDLLRQLCDRDYIVSLETSGSIDISAVDSRVKIVLDIKTPDSGEAKSFLLKNLDYVSSTTEFKFVLCSEEDFYWAEKFLQAHKVFEKNIVLYSPSFGEISEKWLAKKILSENSKARLQLQLHKYIWSEHQRGV